MTRLQGLLLAGGLLGTGMTAAALLRSAAPSPVPSQQPTPVGTSAAELALIAEAQSALAEGNATKARAALQQHGTRFPEGQMKVQRKLLEAYTERLEKGTP
jgi:outer membrane protein assembly factor BamD (BamD/ComL family)